MPKRPAILRLVVPLLLLLLACGPCSLMSQEYPTPSHTVAVSTEAAEQLEARIQQNINGPPGQQFILRTTDSEVTSLLITELEKADGAPLKDPTIWFTRGKIYATGRLVNVLPIETTFSLVAAAEIRGGKIAVTVEQASAGAVPLPNSLLSTLSRSINQTVDELQLGVEVTDLQLLEGEAIVKGVRR